MTSPRLPLRLPLGLRIGLLVVVAAAIPALALWMVTAYVTHQAQEDVQRQVDVALDLAIGLEQSLIESALHQMQAAAVTLAGSPEVSLGKGAESALSRARAVYPAADILLLVDRSGRVISRAGSPNRGDRVSYGGLVDRVLNSGVLAAYPGIIPRAELVPEGEALMERVRVRVLSTPAATDPRVGSVLEDALALIAVAPVTGPEGEVVGAAVAADILNNDFAIVDEVARRSPQGLPVNATIALDGIRVTTNVPAPGGGARAVGTLYSDPVMARLRQGEPYRGRAVVGGWQWQRTIYIPLRDHTGQVVAEPYVGVPEAHFTAVLAHLRQAGRVATIVGFISVAVAALVGHLLIRDRIGRPLLEAADRVHTAAERTDAGARQALAVSASSLADAEAVGLSARETTERVRGLEVALTRLTAGVEEEARAVRHVGRVAEQVAETIRLSRDEMARVLAAARAGLAAAQEARRAQVQLGVALGLVAEAIRTGNLKRAQTELDRGEALAAESERTLAQIAQAAETTLDALWSMAAAVNENGARVTAVAQQMAEVAGAVTGAEAQVGELIAGIREVLQQVEGMAWGVERAVERVRQAQDHVQGIAEANGFLLQLAGRLRELAGELAAREA